MDYFVSSQDIKSSSIELALDCLANSIKLLPLDRQEEAKRYMEEKMVYKIEEVAEALRVSVVTIRRAVSNGKLKAIRLGDGPKAPIRITKKELDRVLEEGM